jgi:hypothetical protein
MNLSLAGANRPLSAVPVQVSSGIFSEVDARRASAGDSFDFFVHNILLISGRLFSLAEDVLFTENILPSSNLFSLTDLYLLVGTNSRCN